MATKNDENWLSNYEALKQWTLEHGHFPNRAKIEGRGLLNWYKYNAKLVKQGKLSPEREQMIYELEEMRSGEHTGGRRKADKGLWFMKFPLCCQNDIVRHQVNDIFDNLT